MRAGLTDRSMHEQPCTLSVLSILNYGQVVEWDWACILSLSAIVSLRVIYSPLQPVTYVYVYVYVWFMHVYRANLL
jgi:hypothetical protein